MLKLISITFLLPIVLSSQARCRALTLAETVRLAVQESPTMDTARRNLLIGQLTETNAFSKFFPSLDFTSTNGVQKYQPASATDPWSSSLAFNLTEHLYDNGESLTQYQIAQRDLRVRQINHLKARDNLVLDVATGFYDFSLAVKLAEVKKEQLAIVERQYESVTNQYRQGLKTKKDFLRSKALVQRSKIDLDSAETSLQLSADNLRRLVGLPVENPAEGISFTALEPSSVEPVFPLRALKIEKNYDYQISQIQHDINALNVDIVRRKYWPTLNLVGLGTYQNSNYLNPQPAASYNEVFGWSALLTVTYNFWDWGILRRQVEIAEANRMVQDNGNKLTVLSANTDLRKVMLQLALLQKDYRLYYNLLTSEEQSFEFFKSDYREGKIPYLDMVTELGHLLDAKVGFYTTYFSVLQNLARYYYYEGTIYEKILSQ